MSDEKVTQSELIEIFGDSIPLEAVSLLFDSPSETPLVEIRAKLRAMATPPAPATDDALIVVVLRRLSMDECTVAEAYTALRAAIAAREAQAAAAATEAERERCAKVALNPGFVQARDTQWDIGFNYAKRTIAAAIRGQS